MAGVTVDFNANLARFENQLNHANARLDSFGDTAQRISGGISTAFAALGVGISVAGIAGVIKSTIDAADNLNDLSIKTGIAVEQLSGLSLASEQSGADLEGTAKAINKLSIEMGKNSDELARLGITADDPLQAFAQLSDIFTKIDDPQQRAALGAKILGKSWSDAAPLLKLGGDELLRIVDNGAKASGVTKELAEASDQFNDTIADLTAGAKGLVVQGVAPLVPILNDLVDYFSDVDDAADENSFKMALLENTYKLIAESIAVVGYGAEIAGKGVGALAAKLGAIATLDFDHLDAIDEAFKEDTEAANKRLLEFFAKVEGYRPAVNVDVTTTDQGGNAKAALSGKIQEFIDGANTANETLKESTKKTNDELSRFLKGIERNIDEESSLYQFRNRQVETALDLGLLSQEDYYRKKESLQKDALAKTQSLLDQEIDALKQFQAQSTDEAARTDAQDKINDLIREKTKLERDGQIATLENAAAAQQALGSYADNLFNVNELLQGVASNIIGISQAQAELNFKTPDTGPATAADLADPNTVFRSADGTSFSDRPTEVGVELSLPENEVLAVQGQLEQFRDQAVADSAILLGVTVDQAAALAGVDSATSAINARLAEIPPVTLGIDVNQDTVVAAAKAARDAAQSAVQPVIVPVIFQAQNSPNAPAPQGGPAFDLAQTALASGGR